MMYNGSVPLWLEIILLQWVQSSVVNLNTLNLDPGFWPNLDPEPGLYNQFWKKKYKKILEQNFFFKKVYLKKN